MRAGHVPTSRIGPVLERLVRERWPHGGGIQVLADKAGCDETAIETIIRQENPGCAFDLADALLCGAGGQGAWWGELRDVYYGIEFVETCALPSCGKTFAESLRSGKRKRFCNDNCRSLYHKMQAGLATGHRHVQRGRCFKGHKMTPENTMLNRQPDGSAKKQCRACRLASMAAYKRKQRRENRDEINRKQREYRARRKAALAT